MVDSTTRKVTMKVIGLTGGIGSGKSTVSQFLKELGAVIIDADKAGHETFKPNTEAWREVVAAFGREVLLPNNEVDRSKLGEIVFNDAEAMTRLNRIMHPRIYQTVQSRLEKLRQQGVAVVVLEAAILIEADWTPLVDEVWVTVTPESMVLERLEKQRGLEKEQTLSRIRSQMSAEERTKHADVVINNDGNLEAVKAKVRELWAGLNK